MEEQQQSSADEKANEPRLRVRSITREAIEQLLKFREELTQETNGQLFEDSAEILCQEREKRTNQLMQAATGECDEEEENATSEQAIPNQTKEIHQRQPATRRMAEELRQFREEIMKERNGKLFEDSAELIRREREKRTEYLMQVISGEYGKDPYEEDRAEEQA